MAFPLYYFLFPLVAFGVVYIIFVLMDLYHLVSFAEMHFVSFVMTFVFLAGAAYICFWGWNLMSPLNWNEQITVFKDVSFNAPTF
jgi:threonine/homoserine/homoserine lactone efflux protein